MGWDAGDHEGLRGGGGVGGGGMLWAVSWQAAKVEKMEKGGVERW